MRCLARVLLLLALLVAGLSPTPARTAELAALFFGAGAAAGPVEGDPPARPVTRDGVLLGYLLSTHEVSGSLGYSGKPIDVQVGLDTAGRIAGARLVRHEEPILVVGISQERLAAFVEALAGADPSRPLTFRGESSRSAEGIDRIAGATVSSTVIAEAVLRSARAVALSRGLLGTGPGRPRLDRERYAVRTWPELQAEGAVTRLTLRPADVAARLGLPADDQDGTFLDLAVALATPPTIGQNLVGRRLFESALAGAGPEDSHLFVAGDGLYSFKGTAWRQSGTFDRIELRQGALTLKLAADHHQGLTGLPAALGAPAFREYALFRIDAASGFDPTAPFSLAVLVTRERPDGTVATGEWLLPYRVPDAYVVRPPPAVAPSADAPAWHGIWWSRRGELAGLGVMLTVLTGILLFQDAVVRNPTRYKVVRLGFLAATVGFLGLYAGAQLSVVNVVTFAQALLAGFRWDLFLVDPLVFVLWSFVAVALVFWGRGVFCGWLCPFGALQELANAAARRLGIRQVRMPWALHERLWMLKYIGFLAIMALSLQSVADAFRLAEIEPFKTVVILKFARDWPFVLYALALLAAGLFVERFYCRYLCPLGAGLALPAKLKLFDWLHRRPQCGRECHVCETTCTVEAIDPIGRISANECIYCLRCQANYHDADTCLVLKQRARRRAPEAGEGASHG
ncbi:4Fe-4S binding protein [Prosthecomicrobium sp. N25]|uniref:4Fe-4S binding protein n=1 Tax=Prosthecomicrobium sp. N25 TaxID=3129254 RepID=UPI003077085A